MGDFFSNSRIQQEFEFLWRLVLKSEGSYNRDDHVWGSIDPVKVVHAMVRKDAKVKDPFEYNEVCTPLYWACRKNYVEIAKFLMEHGADVHVGDHGYGWSPFRIACRMGHWEIAKLLIEYGADVNDKDKDGETSLHEACRQGTLELVKFLIENGANPNAKDHEYGSTPLHCACSWRRTLITYTEGQPCLNVEYKEDGLEMVKLLVSCGASVKMETKEGSTPLQVAVEKGHQDVLWFLVRQYPCLVSEEFE